MLIWICALHCEAKPIIDHYRLEKQPGISGIDLYLRDNTVCIVSGIGSSNMAMACGWAAAAYRNSANAWVNLGIGGHRSLPLGSLTMASRVSSILTSHAIDLETGEHPAFNRKPLISVNQEQTNYNGDVVYDMEGFTFAQSCRRLNPQSRYYCVKIISDNRDSPPTRNKSAISDLVYASIDPILQFAGQLQAV